MALNTIFVATHLGVGDSIICNALVRHLSAAYRNVVFPVMWHNRTSVAWMFSDLPNITLLGVSGDIEVRRWISRFANGGTRVLRLGTFAHVWNRKQWDREFYEVAEIPFERRWTGFKLPALETKSLMTYPPFLHEDQARGFRIDPKRVPSDARLVPRTKTVFELLPWLQSAPEIHVIDSAFLCLADSVDTKAKRLVLHAYARPNGIMPTLRKKWNVLLK